MSMCLNTQTTMISSTMSAIVPYDPTSFSVPSSSSKRTKMSAPFIDPIMLTESAQLKYDAMKFNFIPGVAITFNSHPELLEKLKNIGWDCLVSFSSRFVYAELVSEFYAHMEFVKDAVGTLHSITTYVQGRKIVIDQTLLVEAFAIDPSMLNLPKINHYVFPLDDSVINCLDFKYNLSTVTNQFVPAFLFDTPVCISADYLPPKCQLLSKLLRHNFMPVRFDKKVSPFDLDIIKGILNETLNINLPYFLLTSFEYCFLNNCMGYGLLLTKLFKYLELDLVSPQSQVLKTTNLVTHLVIPSKPLYLFQENENESYARTNVDSQVEILSSMQQILFENQNSLSAKIDELNSAIQNVQSTLSILMAQHEQQYFFGVSVGSVHMDYQYPEDPLPSLNTPLSPVDLSSI